MLAPNKINLAARLREDPAQQAEARARLRRFLPLIAVLVLALVIESAYLFAVQDALNREYDELSEDISHMQPSYADALIRSKQVDLLAGKNIELSRAHDAINSYGELDRALFSGVYLAADRCNVSVDSLIFDRARGTFTLTCRGSKITSASEYITELQLLSAVSSTEYGGYEQMTVDRSADAVAMYRFEITCTISAGGETND